MTIEFRCTTCDKLLRTQPGTEGKKAKCPQCGTLLVIPESTLGQSELAAPPREPDFSAPPTHELPQGVPPGASNPYQSPAAYGQVEAMARGFHPARIDLGETLSRTWEIFKPNMGVCIGAVLLVGACSVVVNVVVQLAFTPVLINADPAGFVVVSIFEQLVAQAIAAFFYIGMILFMLRIARGEGAEFGALFGGGPYFLAGAVIQIIVSVATGIGLLLLIVPGVVIWLMLSQAMFMLVDQRAGIGDSLKLSIEAMKGNKLTVLAIWIVTAVLGFLVTVLTCFIGLLFVAPFAALLMSVIYLGVTGQKTMLDAPAPVKAEG
jgi:uncharacterized membrane protein/DNA-directed RNA polymerase subunit RPC12/RpoP